MISLGLGGCAHIPAHLLLDVDGSTIEFKKKPPGGDGRSAMRRTADEPAG